MNAVLVGLRAVGGWPCSAGSGHFILIAGEIVTGHVLLTTRFTPPTHGH